MRGERSSLLIGLNTPIVSKKTTPVGGWLYDDMVHHTSTVLSNL